MTPAYFNPAAQPDTETQYRQGGKVNKMQKLSVAKKMPRKFQAGGMTKPAEKMTPEMVAKIKAELEAAKTDANQNAAMNNFYDNKTRLNPNLVKKAKGGTVKESKAMAGKEFSFMKKKGAPKPMMKHEMMEAGMKPSRTMKKGGKVAKYSKGGGIESKGKTRGKMC